MKSSSTELSGTSVFNVVFLETPHWFFKNKLDSVYLSRENVWCSHQVILAISAVFQSGKWNRKQKASAWSAGREGMVLPFCTTQARRPSLCVSWGRHHQAARGDFQFPSLHLRPHLISHWKGPMEMSSWLSYCTRSIGIHLRVDACSLKSCRIWTWWKLWPLAHYWAPS